MFVCLFVYTVNYLFTILFYSNMNNIDFSVICVLMLILFLLLKDKSNVIFDTISVKVG